MSQFPFYYPFLNCYSSIPCFYNLHSQNNASPLFYQLSSLTFQQTQNFCKLQIPSDISTPLVDNQSKPLSNSSKSLNVVKKCRRMRRKQRKQLGDQKENRNVLSNILRNFFRKINDYGRIEKTVKEIISKYHLQITPQDFFNFVQKLKVDHTRYIRIKSIKQYFIHSKMDCSLLLRVLFKHYSNEELLVQTLTSRKIGRQSVKCHLEGIYDLMQRLFNRF